jgi:hypothetical protein
MAEVPGNISYHDIERMALGFALEDEMWPVFLEWVRANHVSGKAHDWLLAGPGLERIRREYLAHSPDPVIRALSAMTDGRPQPS